jgi:hypothetical protein
MKALVPSVVVLSVVLSGCGGDKLNSKKTTYSKDPMTAEQLCVAHLSLEAGGQQMCIQGHVMTRSLTTAAPEHPFVSGPTSCSSR